MIALIVCIVVIVPIVLILIAKLLEKKFGKPKATKDKIIQKIKVDF